MKSFLLFLSLLVLLPPLRILADDTRREGQLAQYYYAAHFATGIWSDENNGFGCPVIRDVVETKIAVFAKNANEGTIKLAVALEKTIQKFPQLRRSFLIVSDDDRSTPMTKEELASNLAMLRDIAKQHAIKNLSLAYLQYTTELSRMRDKVGLFESSDVILAIIEPGIVQPKEDSTKSHLPTRTVKPHYRFITRLHSSDITDKTVDAILATALSSFTE